MHDDQGAVLAQVEIEFDEVEAGLLGGDEGTEGVLGLDAHDSAVTDGKEVQGSTRFRRRRLGMRADRPDLPVHAAESQPNGRLSR
ncbi:hypothetical protein GCM10010121_017750 [Streptomyces brasiliensis]|uniref:Uncharacterized protein n=1 Tax=Streptomyces brasiliensis TaxID=1954 RepID=A0A917KC23_9ACTN|nr:hypothetical protein GCM10010121_017750 [Streptomyces brasiliensis]